MEMKDMPSVAFARCLWIRCRAEGWLHSKSIVRAQNQEANAIPVLYFDSARQSIIKSVCNPTDSWSPLGVFARKSRAMAPAIKFRAKLK